MGTNYYLHEDECKTCHRCDEDEKIHIGKSSGGWQFILHSPASHQLPADFLTEIGWSYQSHFDFDVAERELRPLQSWQGWKRLLNWAFFEAKTKNPAIRDEYGNEISVADFVRLVEGKQTPENQSHASWLASSERFSNYEFKDWIDDEGYSLTPASFS